MEKQKKWHRYLILAVLLLTLYNILPTVFYYTKPLKSPIDSPRATTLSEEIVQRVNQLEPESKEWLGSFCRLLKTKPLSITQDPSRPQFITLSFKNEEEANRFRAYLPRAGALIPFVPAQLSLFDPRDTTNKSVIVQRRIPIHFDPKNTENYLEFSKKFDERNQPTQLYRALVEDRATQVALSLAGTPENGAILQAINEQPHTDQTGELIIQTAQNILSYTKAFGENSLIAKRYFATFTQNNGQERVQAVQKFLSALEEKSAKLKAEKTTLQQESDKLRAQGQFLDTVKQQKLELITAREKAVDAASTIVKRNSAAFAAGQNPLTYATIGTLLKQGADASLQALPLQGKNPFVEQILIDWSNEKIYLNLYPDVAALRETLDQSNKESFLRDQIDQLIYNEIAFASRQSGEEISPFQNRFEITLSTLNNSKSFLAMRLSAIADSDCRQLKETLIATWHPKHPDLSASAFPIYDYETFQALPKEDKTFGLVIYAPALVKQVPPQGIQMNSIYIIAKGMDKILERFKEEGNSPNSAQFLQDFHHLQEILQQNGFVGYSGASFGLGPEFSKDFVFEGGDYYHTVLNATRENFSVHGTRRYAILELSDVEQRILTENKIGNRTHEDLLRWRDEYHAAQLNARGVSKYDVPQPTKNVLWDNFKLSFVKYFRGDERKILHWGLDLSGGKTVQIELRDQNNRLVTNPDDLSQGINELYNRVNKMGVSEVSIRREGNHITLDFPGSQALSATELVKASSMFFHIVNEKFSPNNPQLADSVNKFLQEIWNEAIVTNRKNADDINAIAWKHLYGDSLDPDVIHPRTEAARILYDNGLRLSNPQEAIVTSAFNETYSKIALYRGEDFTDWQGQTHPLLFLFRNFALEGSNLENVHASYDSSKGNFLSFAVKGSYSSREGQRISPQEDLYAWTSQFSKETIGGTPAELFSRGKGWRMAVILNGTVISAPALESALKDSAMITGSFTQREVNQLEADLKAGSLSFTPRILSEKNVSPELGSKEKTHGIIATALSIFLVVSVMICYYRFGGLVASVAVLFNLFILWATLQNLEATMTLAGIAAIILTLGMAVDANVLVFERIREEFAISGRIASAVHAGYRKAFSAILDSNVTTIIAAMVLLHFDSGPIKAFAITMIIGIISSMFSALFMTRYFFAGWVQNPKNKTLSMLQLFKAQNFNFLKFTKPTILITSVIILVGSFLLIQQRHTIFGMDFSGGYALNVELQTKPDQNYRTGVEKALARQGANTQEVQVRELSPQNNLRIFLSNSLTQPGHPFYGMPLENDLKEPNFPFETNPRILWVVNALDQSGLKLQEGSLENLHKNWTEVSGQMSDSMRNNALIGLMIALLAILIYITIRFEFKYAISATICLLHDVIFTVGAIALLHALKVPVQIDLNTVAALMTIVGYSLNDIIIVFDRIREDVRLMRKATFTEIINHALNITLSRTVMTSGTTLLVLIPLILLGGSTLFGFSLVMAIGVIFGTLSSLFIAVPLMKFFHDRELEKEEKAVFTPK